MNRRFTGIFLTALIIISYLVNPSKAADIPKDYERAKQTDRYKTIPGFPGMLEFVRDGAVDEALMEKYLKPETIEFVKNQRLNWLQVTNVSIDVKSVRALDNNGVLVPVIAGVRYQKVQNIIDGTANALFHVTMIQNDLKVNLVDYGDNEPQQIIGRKLWQIDFQNFIDKVAGETLRTFFKTPESKQNLITILPH